MQEFMLTDKETQVLIELLRAEERTLEPEIRRTDSRDMKKQLRERLRTVDRLIERFEELGQQVSR
jgi:DNA-binding MarR family transcriptional regulator